MDDPASAVPSYTRADTSINPGSSSVLKDLDQVFSPAPIERLPQELLLVVFKMVALEAKSLLEKAGSQRIRMRDVPWIVLPCVCGRWRTTADMCFDLWTSINFWTTETTEKLLSKSGDHLLDLIFCTGTHTQFSSQPGVFLGILERAPINSACSITFLMDEELSNDEWQIDANREEIQASAEVLISILSTPAPHAVSLYLVFNFDLDEISPFEPPGPPDAALCHDGMSPSDYPLLRHLRLDNWANLPGDDLFFRISLGSLTLSGGIIFQSFTEFFDALACMPMLLSLRVNDESGWLPPASADLSADEQSGHPFERAPGTIELPELKLLEIIVDEVPPIIDIMRYTVIPRTARLVFKCIDRSRSSASRATDTVVDDAVDEVCQLLRKQFTLNASKSGAPFHGLRDLTATIESIPDDAGWISSFLRIHAHYLHLDHPEEPAFSTVERTSLVHIVLSFPTDAFSDVALSKLVHLLPLVLGNNATRLQILPTEPVSEPSTPGKVIYAATDHAQIVSIHRIGVAHFGKTAEPSSSLGIYLPHVAALDYYGLELPLPAEAQFEVRLEEVVEAMEPRLKAGTLREINFFNGVADEAGIEALKERLGSAVKWQD